MKLMFILTLSLLIVICSTGLVMAHDAVERLGMADYAGDPTAFAGRTVEIEARVIAINADGQSLELYDSPSRTRISVQLAQLPKAERKALIRSDVREVVVRGRATVIAGRLTIHAESVQWGDTLPQK